MSPPEAAAEIPARFQSDIACLGELRQQGRAQPAETATRIEDGDLSTAERELRAAQERLKDALESGAPAAEIQRLMAELRQAFDWLAAEAPGHGIAGPVIVTGCTACGHLTAFLLDHPVVTAGLAISGVFELAPLRDSPHVNDQVQLSEEEIETLSPLRLPGSAKPLGIAYGTAELPAMVAASRDFHAYRAQAHLPGELVPGG